MPFTRRPARLPQLARWGIDQFQQPAEIFLHGFYNVFPHKRACMAQKTIFVEYSAYKAR